MNPRKSNGIPSRRNLLAATSGLAAGAMANLQFGLAANNSFASAPVADALNDVEPFFGEHQSGILTPAQAHTYFAAFDFKAVKREEVIELLRTWTHAAAGLCGGGSAAAIGKNGSASDSVKAPAMRQARLSITFGLGVGLFCKNGVDRFGLAARRPDALMELPAFPGDQLIDARTGGDLCIQACADEPQVAFHAVRELGRVANNAVQIRWAQTGFIAHGPAGQTPRNLMGFKDGTRNPSADDRRQMEQFVWAGNEAPHWMRGGSYVVVRRIRMALERWDQTSVDIQEQIFGRRKDSGAPLGGKAEFDAVDLDAKDKDGNALILDNAHIRVAAPESNGGARILRRVYSYNDGVNFTSERWPPWRQGMEYDAGLLFIAYQRDPRTGFVKIFDAISKLDLLNEFVTHTGGGLFACPQGASPGEYIGQALFAPA